MTSLARLACALLCLSFAACRETVPQGRRRGESNAASAPKPVAEAAAPARTGTSAGVYALTGARARVVWVQGDGTDPYAAGNSLVLKGLDTEDGKGERVILASVEAT